MSILINIDTPDVDAAARFYGEALGLKEVRRLFAGRIVEMDLDRPTFPPVAERRRRARLSARRRSASLRPALDPDPPRFRRARHRGRHGKSADVRRGHGAPLVRHVWGAIAGFADPFGHGFCLIELSESGYDAVAE